MFLYRHRITIIKILCIYFSMLDIIWNVFVKFLVPLIARKLDFFSMMIVFKRYWYLPDTSDIFKLIHEEQEIKDDVVDIIYLHS